MKNTLLIFLSILISSITINAQEIETYYLNYAKSYKDTIIYKRVISFDKGLYHVKDYYSNGQIQLEGTYSAFDKTIKEKSLWCNYKTNTKEGEFKKWYKNGQLEGKANYSKGLRNGLHEYWYSNGKRESIQNYKKGQKHGECVWWNKDGTLQRKIVFEKGENQFKKDTTYHYISYTPKEYNKNQTKKWPLIIYLHGGSSRGNDTTKLYSNGIPDQIWRGREFPFVIISPQCPINQRWSTDNWFENFYKEITTDFRIDTNKVYLTGVSLGGSGTWYLAMKHPEKFAAIAPVSGFTRHMDYIKKNTDKLNDLPIWTFHGKIDKIVEFEDTEWVVKQLREKNKEIKFTIEPNVGHWMDWVVYKEEYLYKWFLKHDKRNHENE
ncbi:MAG: alpha/beta hydrolase-fold protein [Bacteroidota bacterium]